ncbi:MAG: peptide-methionine (S)-S-oxide reductase MsrA [Spirochaetota bacterium]|nr:peptide-methionine (S)-S-oxide reductase MsrA [Spirochaetota bacterium]
MDNATLGGGCFWCLEAVYLKVDGVLSVVSGYAGGHSQNPTYQEVCSETTGHAEVLRLDFDPDKISFSELLDIFWIIHDPTTPNRQGNDVGSQYRSIILYHSDEQRVIAENSIKALEAKGLYRNKIVTELLPLEVFYPAEDYHQNYYETNPGNPYCQLVVKPKLDKYLSHFSNGKKPEPGT